MKNNQDPLPVTLSNQSQFFHKLQAALRPDTDINNPDERYLRQMSAPPRCSQDETYQDQDITPSPAECFSFQRQLIMNGIIELRMQPQYQEFFQQTPFQKQMLEPITAEDEDELARQLKQAKFKFEHLGWQSYSDLEHEETRRRTSSNFFDILSDPKSYHEHVQNFVTQNFQDEEEETKEVYPNPKRLVRPSFEKNILKQINEEPNLQEDRKARLQAQATAIVNETRHTSDSQFVQGGLIDKFAAQDSRDFKEADISMINIVNSPQPKQKKKKATEVLEHPTVAQIAQQFKLTSTYETLEGADKLNREDTLRLLQFSYPLTKDQGGCRYLQQVISRVDPQTLKIIFEKTIPYFRSLMSDPFGNYLAQKQIELCTDEQLMQIINSIQDGIVELCKGMHGTRTMQKLIEVTAKVQNHSRHRQALTGFIQPNLLELSHEINGNHVIFKILTHWHDKQFIYDEMISKCKLIACHKHGCCIMQKCIDNGSPQQKEMLTLTIAKNTCLFVRDPFANYVIQFILDLKMRIVSQEVGYQLLGSILKLSLEKFSSNVIEKCLENTTDEIRFKMVEEICQAQSFFPFLVDQYANYVIQKALQVAVEPLFSNCIGRLKIDLPQVALSGDFGLKIYQRLSKQYPQLIDDQSQALLQRNQSSTRGSKNQQPNKNQQKKETGRERPNKRGHKQSDYRNVNINININTFPAQFQQQPFQQQPLTEQQQLWLSSAMHGKANNFWPNSQ